ncbi:MAG TPA: PQQ-binding-like beta-propeller repeat protein, partial [Candidatus Sumerlaeota bacterium]|nr:PQQ-binding-like beta-propeller repeat protein [Candidatus Sumerlaeota bacterium]
WSVEMASYSAANAAAFGDGIYVGHYGGAVLASDLKDGHALWTFTPPQNDQVPFHAACAVQDDVVVAASRDKNVYGIERASGKLLWQFPTKEEIDAAPVIVGGRVFVASRDGNLYGLDLKSGTKAWVYESGSSFKAAPAVVAPKLVLGDVDGSVYCFGPAEAGAPGQAGTVKAEGAAK